MTDLSFENSTGRADGLLVCGIDEVGRGPLAGPVVAAAVIIPAQGLPDEIASHIRDSKKLSPKQREALFQPLMELCDASIAEASVEEIDTLNILQATFLAMRRALEGLPHPPAHALIDGNKKPPGLLCPATTIVKGDDKSLSIAAASIVAKVTRDRFMAKLAETFPGYGWETNAGYGTATHLAALTQLGPTIWHRRSFAPVAQAIALTK